MTDSNLGPLTFNYPSTPLSGEEWRVVDRFDSSYWSGRDVCYYFDNIKLDEVIQLTWQAFEKVTPFYGYASYIPDALVHGQRLISGEISMNFKREGYMFSLLNLVKTTRPEDVWVTTKNKKGNPIDTSVSDWGISSSPSAAAASLKTGELSPAQVRKLVQEQYQKEISSSNSSKFPAVIEARAGMYETRKGGFDINIIFGADLRNELALRYDGNSEAYADVIRVPSEHIGDNVATGIKLIGASISGKGKTIGDDGRPILETYSFMARDIRILNVEDLDSPN